MEAVVFPFSFKHTLDNPWQNDILQSNEVRDKIEYVVDKADVIVWQTLTFQHSLDFFVDLKAKYQKPFLMELDDYIDDIPADHEAFGAYSPASIHYRIPRQQLRMSDGLIVSTPYLAKQYEGRCPNIHVVPNSIDFDEWEGLAHKKHSRLRIGWIGGGTHGKDLELVQEALDKILRDHQDVWFYCIHGVPKFVKDWAAQGRHVYHTPKWSYINLYPRFMASFDFDIGIAPLVDNNFNRGKSNLRWLEYSALQIPTVASPLPDFKRVIDDGRNGFLANNTDQWIRKLTALVDEHSTRARCRETMGKSAFEFIKANFNANKTSSAYLKLLRQYNG